MTTRKFIKVFSFLLIFAVGFLAMQSCCDSKEKKNDKQTTEIKAESSEGKCGDGKCGDGKVEKDSTKTKEGKCGDGKCGDDKKATEEKDSKCGEG